MPCRRSNGEESVGAPGATTTLALIGPPAKAALPALRNALKDSDSEVRLAAAKALWRIDPQSPEVLAALAEALKDKDPAVRAEAAAELRAYWLARENRNPGPGQGIEG